jgi:hypothetical protein
MYNNRNEFADNSKISGIKVQSKECINLYGKEVEYVESYFIEEIKSKKLGLSSEDRSYGRLSITNNINTRY